jgi:hypothetical protein
MSNYIYKNINKSDITYRVEKSVNGYSIDILKSGLQKSIRRKKIIDALYYGYELDLFAFIENGEKLRTNLIHRLMIIYMEDIGIANLDIYEKINECIFNLINYRELRKKDETLFYEYRKKEINNLTNIIYLLCYSKHGRECSYYKNVFNDLLYESDISIILETKYTILSNNKKRILDSKNILNKITGYNISKEFNKEALDNANLFLYYLEKKDELCIYYFFILYKNNKTLGKFYKSSKNAFGIFYLLEFYINLKLSSNIKEQFLKYLKISIKWFKELNPIKEDFLTCILLILGLINSDNLLKNDVKYLRDDELYTLSKLYIKNTLYNNIDIKDYILDMHTKV